MAISYNRLWKLLVDKKMSKADLRKQAEIAPNTMTKLRRDEPVNMSILARICETLQCDFGDIVEYIREDVSPENKMPQVSTTLEYYDRNAAEFSKGTLNVDFSVTQERFLKKLKENACILDFGCGSGRDTKYFLEKGYRVDAIDGSEELCRLASEYTGITVKKMFFQELKEIEKYDGIWACSSILHLNKTELKSVISKMITALKPDGIIYTSFKYGDFEGERNGRFFTDFTEYSFEEYIQDIPEIGMEEVWITGDVRPGRSEENWLNLILRKK